jgi:hypothetical protein
MGLHGPKFRNNKIYTDCDFIIGIRRPAIIVCLQRGRKILAGHKYKDNPEVPTVVAGWLITHGSDRY